nr:cytochrome P450 6a17 [Geocoris pallidipennis]
MLTLALSVAACSLLLWVVHWFLEVNRHWEKRGIKCLTPLPVVGNTLPLLLKQKPQAILYWEICKTFPNEPIIGYYDNTKPRLIVQDAEYIEKIFIKDFQHFVDHGVGWPDEKKQPIDHYQLFSMRGTKWRAFRNKVTPLFTSGKLKCMFDNFNIVGKNLISHVEGRPMTQAQLHNAMHLFSLDFVGLSIFGLNAEALLNPESEFYKYSQNVFDMTNYFKLVMMTIFPDTFAKLGFSINNQKAVKYFCGIIQDAFSYRRDNKIVRNDFIQMMIQLKEKGKIDIHKWDPNDDYLKDDLETVESFEITEVNLLSQAYTFMVTGLEAVSLSIQNALYLLAINQDIQRKAREEIQRKIETHSGLTYDALKNMTYLENIISETFRLYPLSQGIFRVCTKDYTFPNGYTIKEGERLHIPGLAVHMNPNYHPEPDKFNPERFHYPMKPGSYIPFGDGPRVCIAMRFALLQVKYAVAKMLSHYLIKLNPRTEVPSKFKFHGFMLMPTEPYYFDLEKL